MSSSIIGLYNDKTKIRSAVTQFKAAGFDNSEISVVDPEQDRTDEFSHGMGTKVLPGAIYGILLGTCIGACVGGLIATSSKFNHINRPFYLHTPFEFTLAFSLVCAFIFMFIGGMLGMAVNEYSNKRTGGRPRVNDLLSDEFLLEIDSEDSRLNEAESIMDMTGAQAVRKFENSWENKTSFYETIEKEFSDFRKVRESEGPKYV